jgi:hypothetical protein
MEVRQLIEVLSEQIDRLQAGEDPTETLLAAERQSSPSGAAERLEGLLRVAQLLHAVLVPVEPRAGFVAGLKEHLLARGASPSHARPARVEPWLWWAAGVGGVVSLVGLGIWGYKAWTGHRGGLSGIIPARAAPTMVPEA